MCLNNLKSTMTERKINVMRKMNLGDGLWMKMSW